MAETYFHVSLPIRYNLGEPIDFFIRWLPALGHPILICWWTVLFFFPDDAVEGLDRDVYAALAKKWPGAPLLR